MVGWSAQGLPLVLLLALLPLRVAAQTNAAASVPALPSVVLETFPESARVAIQRAIDLAKAHADDAAACGALGMTLQAWEQWETAHTAYERASRLSAQDADWLYLDGVVLQRLGRPADASERFQRALTLAPESVTASARLAEALFDAGDLEASRRAYTALSGEPSAAPVSALGLGRVAARAGRHEDAVGHFRQAIALFPEFGAAYYGLAQSLRALGRSEEARDALKQHTTYGARWPAIDDPLTAKVAALRDDPRVLLARGLREASLGDLPAAIASHEAAIAADPKLAQGRANLISLYGRTAQWEKAEAQYRALLAMGFNEDEAHYNYGVLLGLQKRWAEATAAYRLTIEANPLHAQARNNLGQLLEVERKFAEATEQYRLAVAADPLLRLARYNLGRMLLASRQVEEAVTEFDKLREPRDAESPRYWYGLAVATVQAGRRQQGVALAQQARELAEQFGQQQLVAAIDRDLAGLK